jgi:glycosyltransferase involved in cell wall biosynthesis
MLDSIFKQTLKDYEVIAISDDVTDTKTHSALEVYGAMGMNITRIQVPARGYPACNLNNNEGVAAASGEFVIFLDDDDFLTTPHYFGTLNNIAKSKLTDMVISRCREGVPWWGKRLEYPRLMGRPPREGDIGTSCACVRTEVARKHQWGDTALGDFKFIRAVYDSLEVDSVQYNGDVILQSQGRGRGFGKTEY